MNLLNLSQEFKQNQQLLMTPQMRAAIEILTLPQMELKELLEKEMEENPLLEFEENPHSKIHDLYSEETHGKQRKTLQDHFKEQLAFCSFSQEEKVFALYLIYNINQDGFFDSPWDDLTKETSLQEEKALNVLSLLQKLDPIACFTWSPKESLILQAEQLILSKDSLSLKQDILFFLKNKFPEIPSCYLKNEKLMKIFQELSAYPGRLFSSEAPLYIIPDIYVYPSYNNYMITQNKEALPHIRMVSFYQDLFSQNINSESKKYLEEKIKKAEWLLKSFHYRQNILLKIARVFTKLQSPFFTKGPSFLKEMNLKDVANELGVNISTISRACSLKYMQTPFGIFEFKYFFSKKSYREDFSSPPLKDMILELIMREDQNLPLSDEQIKKIINSKGIHVARRTINKYREELGIPSSSLRKSHNFSHEFLSSNTQVIKKNSRKALAM